VAGAHPRNVTPAAHSPVVVLAIDGLCFAGKTTVARVLATRRQTVVMSEYADLSIVPP
jgi:uridine kinase